MHLKSRTQVLKHYIEPKENWPWRWCGGLLLLNTFPNNFTPFLVKSRLRGWSPSFIHYTACIHNKALQWRTQGFKIAGDAFSKAEITKVNIFGAILPQNLRAEMTTFC